MTRWLATTVTLTRWSRWTGKGLFGIANGMQSRRSYGKPLADFQNPQQEPGTERRLLLVFAITFLIILASQPLLKKYGPKPSETAKQTQNEPVSPPSPAAVSPPTVPVQPPAGTKQAEVAAHSLHDLGQKLKLLVEQYKM